VEVRLSYRYCGYRNTKFTYLFRAEKDEGHALEEGLSSKVRGEGHSAGVKLCLSQAWDETGCTEVEDLHH